MINVFDRIAAYRQRADEREQFFCGCIVNRLHRSMKMGLEFLEVVELVGKAEQQTQSSRRKQICEGIARSARAVTVARAGKLN